MRRCSTGDTSTQELESNHRYFLDYVIYSSARNRPTLMNTSATSFSFMFYLHLTFVAPDFPTAQIFTRA